MSLSVTLEKVDPELAERGTWVVLMGEGDLYFSSAWRDPVKQQQLVDSYAAALKKYGTREKAIAHGIYPANSPETSKHCWTPAKALDIAITSNTRKLRAKRAKLVQLAGLHTPIKDEPHHCELAPGRKSLPTPKEDNMVRALSPEQRSQPATWPTILVGFESTKSGDGYWMVAADGGVFCFGDAEFHGSMGGQPINAPIVGVARTRSGGGYWLVGADGGIFSFGDAEFFGSMGSQKLNAPVTDIRVTPSGKGYWLVAEDWGLFSFGDAKTLSTAAGLFPAELRTTF
jgi:hypothetical protein